MYPAFIFRVFLADSVNVKDRYLRLRQWILLLLLLPASLSAGADGEEVPTVAPEELVQEHHLPISRERLFETEGRNQDTTAVARDKAGNITEVTSSVSIDLTAPKITVQTLPSSNSAGWNSQEVTVQFLCSDALSGVDTCSDAQTEYREGAGLEILGSAQDLAGNRSSTNVLLNIDKTPPALAVKYSQAPNSAGWYKSPVTLTYSCDDVLSGVALCPQVQTVSDEGGNLTVLATAEDKAGNSAEKEVVLKIDQTAPALAFTFPLDGAVLTDHRPPTETVCE